MLRHALRRGLTRLLWIGLGAASGVLLFHLLVMPRFVRRGEETLVPDLRGLPATEMERLLEGGHLRAGSLARAHDDQIPIGRILRQSPPPGFRVKRGREVDMVVSLGPEALRVPSLEGESLVHARFLLQQLGLEVGKVRRAESASLPANHLIATSPRPGTPLHGRAAVDLLVSSGPTPRYLRMPDLRGRNAEETARQLADAGFTVGRRLWPGARTGFGEVRDQTPPVGYPIRVGGTVELVTGR
jgi:serine/threonine-protein kinase